MQFPQFQFTKPFHYRDFRFLYISEICFFISMWMAAMVYGLIATHIKGSSPFYQGLIGLGFNLPMMFGPFIGAVVDRNQRKTILRIAAVGALITALLMTGLLIKGWPNFWVMLLVVIVQGFVMVFYSNAQLTSTQEIITDPHVVPSGFSLINATNRISMFFGYSIGGLLVTWFGEQSTYLFNAILYLCSVLLLMGIKTTVPLDTEKKSVILELQEGLSFLKKSPPIIAVIVLLGLLGAFAWPFIFQMPAVNRYYLHGTPANLGMLMAIGGVGGIAGSFWMSARKSSLGLNRIIIVNTLLLVIALILLSLCRSVHWAMLVLFLIDLSLMVILTAGMVLVQQLTPAGYQGRIMGILFMFAFGTLPIGSVVFYGGLGELFGVMTVFAIAAIIVLVGLIWYWLKLPIIRQFAAPILLEKGLIHDKSEETKI